MENSYDQGEYFGTLILKKGKNGESFPRRDGPRLFFKDYLVTFNHFPINEIEIMNINTFQSTNLTCEGITHEQDGVTQKKTHFFSVLNWKENKCILLGQPTTLERGPNGIVEKIGRIEAKIVSIVENDENSPLNFSVIETITIGEELPCFFKSAQIHQSSLFLLTESKGGSWTNISIFLCRFLVDLNTFNVKNYGAVKVSAQREYYGTPVWHKNSLSVYGGKELIENRDNQQPFLNQGNQQGRSNQRLSLNGGITYNNPSSSAVSLQRDLSVDQDPHFQPEYSRQTLCFVLNNTFYFVDNSRFWKCDPHTASFEKLSVFGFQLPLGQLQLSQFGNQVLFWEAGRELKQVFLLTVEGFDPESYLPKKLVQQSLHPLLTHLQNFQENAKFTDITIIVDGFKFPANKVALTSCRYFRNMFESNMEEASKKEIIIEDMTPMCFKAILDTIYARKIVLDEELASELIIQADKLLLDELKEECETFLINRTKAKEISDESFVKLSNINNEIAPNLRKQLQNFLDAFPDILDRIDKETIPPSMVFSAFESLRRKQQKTQ